MKESARDLFSHWQETMVWSCLQGIMGRLEASDSGEAGRITLGDFCFLAGRPDRQLVETAPAPILVPRTEDWHPVIREIFGSRAVPAVRYATWKEPGAFDRQKLKGLVSALPPGYSLRAVDAEMAQGLLTQTWSRDFCSNFDGPADFGRRGLGVAALWEGAPVAGAASYSVYDGGIEIEIDTRADHRCRGLASACGAALILACLERGLYPSWDAQDLRSLHLAEKLGYRAAGSYPVFLLENTAEG